MWELLLFVIGVSCADIVETIGTANETTNDHNNSRSLQKNGVPEEDIKNVVVTEHGPVRGYENNGVVQFFDIPYGRFSAEGRFQNSSKPVPWVAIQEKTEHTSRCPQINIENAYIGTPECLTLSVFKPQSAESSGVLFYIHDSNFSNGSGDPQKYIPKNLVSKDLIVVLPNYRLGPLGFLCFQNRTAPGNAGLKDLSLALKWTFDNIKNFGGNASNIVVSGSGAAGAMVEYLLLFNGSRSFISKAIVESGFTLSPWALDRNPLRTAEKLVDKLHTAGSSINSIEQADIEQLIRAAKDIDFRPCIESEAGFLNHSPWALLENQTLKIPYMSGSANEAAMEEAFQQTEESLSHLNLNTYLLLPSDLKFDNDEERDKVGNQVKNQYFGENDITMDNRIKLSQCLSDSKYIYPGIRGARLLIKGGSTVFFYEFSYSREADSGAGRGAFINLVFSKIDTNDEGTSYTENEDSMKTKITNIWVNFIKTGNPSTDAIEWKNMTAEEEWLSIGNEFEMHKGFHAERMKLWNDIYEKHFVEHNIGLELKPSTYITLASLIFLVDFRIKCLI
ncbi:unnamed protein product, partial [Brenthis ino]